MGGGRGGVGHWGGRGGGGEGLGGLGCGLCGWRMLSRCLCSWLGRAALLAPAGSLACTAVRLTVQAWWEGPGRQHVSKRSSELGQDVLVVVEEQHKFCVCVFVILGAGYVLVDNCKVSLQAHKQHITALCKQQTSVPLR